MVLGGGICYLLKRTWENEEKENGVWKTEEERKRGRYWGEEMEGNVFSDSEKNRTEICVHVEIINRDMSKQ